MGEQDPVPPRKKPLLSGFTRAAFWGDRRDADKPDVGKTIVASYDPSANNSAADDLAYIEDVFAESGHAAIGTSSDFDGPVDAGIETDDEPVSLSIDSDGMAAGSTSSLTNSSYTPYYQFFDDPNLTALIDLALQGNQELKILAQEIQIANYEIMARRGEYLPFVTFGTGIGLEKPSLFTPQGAVEDQLEVLPGKAFPDPLPDFLAAANVSWEIDIWRKLRNARDAATMRYFATQEGQNYIVTRMVAEVAENYYELLALDNRLMILDQTIALQQRSLALAEARKDAGEDTDLPVQRFQAEVRKNESQKLIVQQQIVEVENRINYLLGRYPQHVQRQSANYIDLTLPVLSKGVPSQLLRNRADVRQAEREVAATGLDVRVARARFYPSLALTGGVGLQAFSLRYLFDTPESLIYNIAGELVAPVINRKAIRADYLSANAQQLQAVYKYQQTILNAFTEVINRMAKVENYGQSIVFKRQQMESLEEAVEIATGLFQSDEAEYVEVLLAQRDLLEARNVLIETKQEQMSAIINAYQAVGGGGVRMNFQ